jgi:hypothetical protein
MKVIQGGIGGTGNTWITAVLSFPKMTSDGLL